MDHRSEKIKEEEKYAKKVCLVIGAIGIIIFGLLNWNFHIIFSGDKYKSEVKEISDGMETCYRIKIEFTRTNGDIAQKLITDCTGESFLFWIKEGDSLLIWESRTKPYKHFVPFANFIAKPFIAFFFIFIPFLFAIYGRY